MWNACCPPNKAKPVVAGVVGVVGAGGGGIAAEVAPVEGESGEDSDRGAAGAAERDELVVFGVVGAGWGDCGEGDLEGLGIDHAQVGERGLDLVGGGLGEAVGAVAGCGVQAGVGFPGGVVDDGGHDLLQVRLVGV
jgi:hypothetical protein